MASSNTASHLLKNIKPVETIENERKSLFQDFEDFKKLEISEELKHYLEEEKWVNSEGFKRKKAEIEALTFKGSTECNQLKEYTKLGKSGKIRNYLKIEGSNDLKRYEGIKNSEKINEYDKLLEYINEGQFKKEKKEIESQVFKGSVEERHLLDFKKLDKSAGIKAYKELYGSPYLKQHETFTNSEKLKNFVKLRNTAGKTKEQLKEFKSLKKDSEIKAYFKFENSKKLRFYKETVDSHELKRFNELKSYIEKDEFKKREAFLKDKKKFEKSETYQKLQQFKRLSSESDIKFLLKFEKSKLYKNYLDMKDSFHLKRYFELKEITGSKEFSERKAFLEDKNRWQKTEEYARLQEFMKMKALPQFVKYFQYKDSDAFDLFTNWEVAFEDDFKGEKLDKNKWSNILAAAEKTIGENLSMPGDLHKFNEGKNIRAEGKLSISVKKEKVKGKVWKIDAGFMPEEFDYTSDMITTEKSFNQADGIFEAKVKFDPSKQVASSLYLCGEHNLPKINLVEMGIQNNIGVSSVNGSGKIENNGLDISELQNGRSYIFTLAKEGSSLSWKINDQEVYAINDSSVSYPLHINASSIVVDEIPESLMPVHFEIEWIKCYRKK